MWNKVEDISECKSKRGKLILFGVEVEMEFKRGSRAIYEEFEGFDKKDDGSLRGGIEYVFNKPYNYKKSLELIKNLYERLKEHDYVISERTSTHIHMDVRDFNPYQLASLLTMYYFYEASFVNIASEERRNNKFCITGLVSPLSIKNAFDLFSDDYSIKEALAYGRRRRYCAMNVLEAVKNFGSVEFRFFEGNLDYSKFEKWLKMLYTLGSTAKKYTTRKHLFFLFNCLFIHNKRFFKKVFPFLEYKEDINVEVLSILDNTIRRGYL